MRRVLGLLAALLVGSAAGLVAAAGPAAAAACPAGHGVTVVVGSGVSCDGNGEGRAASSFGATGHSLTMVDRQPGFVCRVDGAPSSANCVNTPPGDAYWGLFWSDGTSGKWTYASQGVGSLKVPAGGWVALVFQTSSSKTYPGVDPVSAAPAPAATKPPAAKPTAKATATPRKKAAAPTATTPAPGRTSSTATATPGATAAPTPTATPSATGEATAPAPSASPTSADQPGATPDATDDIERTSSDADTSRGSGSLGWVAVVLGIALLAGMGAVLWRRKAAGGPS